jgi:hypothetical protein
MAITVKFASGEERVCEGDAAILSDSVFVIRKYDRQRRKHESVATFPADQVAWARLANGNIVLGKGKVQSD